jgi:hypothetical protein
LSSALSGRRFTEFTEFYSQAKQPDSGVLEIHTGRDELIPPPIKASKVLTPKGLEYGPGGIIPPYREFNIASNAAVNLLASSDIINSCYFYDVLKY